jgi:sugar phosphate isomerase/epimerase
MRHSRRRILAALAATAPAAYIHSFGAMADSAPQPLGVVIHSYTQRTLLGKSSRAVGRIDDPFVLLETVRAAGGVGIQSSFGVRDEAECRRLRALADKHGMYLEASIRLPRDAADLDRFRAEVQSAVWAGISVIRTVMFDGRRYETFSTDAEFRRAADRAVRSLELAAGVVAGKRVSLAVENHKDWLAGELIAVLKRIGSECVGACLDTGNSIALLEDPMEVVETFAPSALTVHLKDMAVQEYEQGFLLSEVPLGEGFLDIPRIVRTVRQARPQIRLNLEMITRDPLKVPCLSERYWATFGDVTGRTLARALAMVRAHRRRQPLPRVEGLSVEDKLKAEDANVAKCLAYAKEHL